MLKITKGLKKKKKGKKGKHKEEELFEEAELEQYRKEQEEKRRQQAEAGEGEGESEGKKEAKGEEWEKFKALTSGVDTVLKKTQGDLDRIKSTSYFQRKPTPSEQEKEKQENQEQKPETSKDKKKDKKWVGFEDGTVDLVDQSELEKEEEASSEAQVQNEEASGSSEQKLEEPVEEEEEEEEFQSDEEDIFDTSYVDAVASGEVKLAYIPDSPKEEDDGFDPFDTSIVDKVIKEDPAAKKKRELVSLGCAVDVLTGRVENPKSIVDIKPKKSPRRQRPRDLLLGSFDEGGGEQEEKLPSKEPDPEEPVKTLLDDDPELGGDIELDLSINLAPIVAPPTPSPLAEVKGGNPIQSILSEFDSISQVNNSEDDKLKNSGIDGVGVDNVDDDLDDEFAVLAAESLTKEVTKVSPITVQDDSNPDNKQKPTRPPPPGKQIVNEDEEVNNYEDDPFDTSFAADILPGKYELRLIEEEILKEDTQKNNIPAVSIRLPKSPGSLRDPLAVDEHNLLDDDIDTQQTPLSFKHRDLLGGSTTDLSKISHSPIEPALVTEKNVEELSYCDPFDTSVVSDLVAPGKAELKFLEQELLAEGPNNIKEKQDDDFNPRAESPPRKKSIPRPEQLFIGEKRQSISKVVAFRVDPPEPVPDLLSEANNEIIKASKPLTPYYPEPKLLENNKSCESETAEIDPFDTSFVSSAPGKLELKLIENEFVGSAPVVPTIPRIASDPEFDPRAAEPQPEIRVVQPSVVEVPKQLPVVETKPDFLSEDVTIDTKLHTPVEPKRIEEELELNYSDPFDTSIAQHILPGKAELKLLESELIESDAGVTIKRSYTDPDFDPRLSDPSEQPFKEEPKQKPPELDFTEQPIVDEVAEKPLTPLSASFTTQEEEIDPFDTSCVGDLIPGKAELKLLESELIHN